MGLERVQYLLFIHTLVRRDQPQNAVERAYTDRIVIRYRDALMRGRVRLQNNVTAFLVDLAVLPMLAKNFHDLAPGKVTRNFHAASTSSRTKWRRIERAGFSGWSK